jgi:predicted RNA-binding protein YlqC (UPF0109 family)
MELPLTLTKEETMTAENQEVNAADNEDLDNDNDRNNVAPLEDEDLLLEMVRAIVSHPEDVKVDSREEDDGRKNLIISAHEEDCGKVIGKHGRMAAILKDFMISVGAQQGHQIFIEIKAPYGSRPTGYRPGFRGYPPNRGYPPPPPPNYGRGGYGYQPPPPQQPVLSSHEFGNGYDPQQPPRFDGNRRGRGFRRSY